MVNSRGPIGQNVKVNDIQIERRFGESKVAAKGHHLPSGPTLVRHDRHNFIARWNAELILNLLLTQQSEI
jgi:hypothetical protein